ncbi:LacI family DNA-binding transcriptional regulator [Pseudomonas sp. dw_358]|uniref:LacI family DNA-binding transcriptional regulator n=1 Tax=Pseudomonas sp. dw_358 TaxID=2720083 RepID=UPI001BD6043B|nr:LacI family DNA-binding transcriptional regulator [Pseudomonas sp. dw_358]
MNNKRPTIATVAEHARLSVATVDRVLNARAPVNAETADRVFQSATAVGYFAARLIGQRIREQRPSYRFGILLLGTAQAFYANLAQAISTAAGRQQNASLSCHFDYVIDRSPTAVAAQIRAMAGQCDGLAVVSFAHPQVSDAIAQARADGTAVVALLSEIEEDSAEPYVGLDNAEVGRTMGWLLAHTCPSRQGSIGILLGGHRFIGHQRRVEALCAYLQTHAPGLRVLEPVINLDNNDVTEEATLELISRFDDLRGLCVVGGGGDGIISALRQLPERPALCSVLLESTELSRQALRDGLITLVVDSQPRQVAEALVTLLVQLQDGQAFDPARHRVRVPLQIMTSENVR